MKKSSFLVCALLLGVAAPLAAQQTAPSQSYTAIPPKEGDFVVHDFKFGDGETLPELRLHYTTIGEPQRDASGRVTNAVLILHGTGGSGRGFLSRNFAGVLFGP